MFSSTLLLVARLNNDIISVYIHTQYTIFTKYFKMYSTLPEYTEDSKSVQNVHGTPQSTLNVHINWCTHRARFGFIQNNDICPHAR